LCDNAIVDDAQHFKISKTSKNFETALTTTKKFSPINFHKKVLGDILGDFHKLIWSPCNQLQNSDLLYDFPKSRRLDSKAHHG
jgi:hypothetical protein